MWSSGGGWDAEFSLLNSCWDYIRIMNFVNVSYAQENTSYEDFPFFSKTLAFWCFFWSKKFMKEGRGGERKIHPRGRSSSLYGAGSIVSSFSEGLFLHERGGPWSKRAMSPSTVRWSKVKVFSLKMPALSPCLKKISSGFLEAHSSSGATNRARGPLWRGRWSSSDHRWWHKGRGLFEWLRHAAQDIHR